MFESPSDPFFSPLIDNPRSLPNGLIEERVRVDRKLYEKLVYFDDFAAQDFPETPSAEDFFGSIMTATNTEITWPSRLRLNTRSRKDPHIKIIGTPEAVKEAKTQIFSLLDTRKNRVTLKMDVSFTDHSHVIGKGGRSIQKVMDDTGCHIHFPDSNRTNAFEKSNQVSIAGTAGAAEHARCRVRELLPITVLYEIPVTTFVRSAMDPNSMVLSNLQRSFGISVTFRAIPVRASSFGLTENVVQVAVRGSRSLLVSVRQGIAVLLEQLTGGLYSFNSTPATIETEVAAQHHSFVMGRGNCNVRSIMQKTGCVISFPETCPPIMGLSAPSASSLPNKKSTITVKAANFDAAYLSWQELLGLLPLVLIFDLPEGQECDSNLITQLMDSLKVSILVKPKQKQNNKSVMVRAAEKDSRLLFEVRRQFLNLDASEVPFCCEQHYWNSVSTSFSSTFTPAVSPVTSFKNPASSLNISRPSAWNDQVFNQESRGRISMFDGASAAVSSSHAFPSVASKSETVLPESKSSVACFFSDSGDSRKTSFSDERSCYSRDEGQNVDGMFATELDPLSKLRRRAFEKVHEETPSSRFDPPFTSLDAEFYGMGLSKTVHDSLRNGLRSIQSENSLQSLESSYRTPGVFRTESETWGETTVPGFSSSTRVPSSSSSLYGSSFSQSNRFPTLIPNPVSVFRSVPPQSLDKSDLPDILSHFGFSQYLDKFENVNLRQFLNMTPQDLLIRGIPFNARENITTLIKQLRPIFFPDLFRNTTQTVLNSTSTESNASSSSHPFSSTSSREGMTSTTGSSTTNSSSQSSCPDSSYCLTPGNSSRSLPQSPPSPSLPGNSVSDDVFTFHGSLAPGAERFTSIPFPPKTNPVLSCNQ